MPADQNPDSTPSLLERVLAIATLTIIVVAVTSYIVTLIVGMNDHEVLADGLWPLVTGIAFVGLPLGFVTLILLLFLSMRRRGREADASHGGHKRKRGGTR
ncbi:hypothetical protein [Leucobacter sp. GX24907]